MWNIRSLLVLWSEIKLGKGIRRVCSFVCVLILNRMTSRDLFEKVTLSRLYLRERAAFFIRMKMGCLY